MPARDRRGRPRPPSPFRRSTYGSVNSEVCAFMYGSRLAPASHLPDRFQTSSPRAATGTDAASSGCRTEPETGLRSVGCGHREHPSRSRPTGTWFGQHPTYGANRTRLAGRMGDGVGGCGAALPALRDHAGSSARRSAFADPLEIGGEGGLPAGEPALIIVSRRRPCRPCRPCRRHGHRRQRTSSCVWGLR